MSLPVLIDCDPGIDDAAAILMALAAPGLEVLGITTVAGNADLDQVTRNALALSALAGRRVPVAAGAEKPLVRERRSGSHIHGQNGLGGVELPEPGYGPDPRPAATFIRDLALGTEEGVDLVCLAPLTNIALALSACPDLARGPIRRIHMMGGSAGPGNATPAAEFNIYADPQAAAAVFMAGIPITMCGLDVTNKALLGEVEITALRRVGKVGSTLADMLGFYLAAYRNFGRQALALHDAVPVAALLEPGVVATKACHVEVETEDERSLGKTIVDQAGAQGREPNADLALGLDYGLFMGTVTSLIGSLG
jgi:pyrimidine-specific ribonucleoside hydrolase